MRVLQMVKKFPYPLKDGEALAVNFLSRSLTVHGCTIDLLAINTNKHYFDPAGIHDVLPHYRNKWIVDVNTDITASDAFINLFSSESYHISRFKSNKFKEALNGILSENTYDVILMESIYMGPYIVAVRAKSNAVLILRAHNIEFMIWERVAHQTNNVLKKIYLKYLSKKLKRYEIGILNEFDGIVPISPVDSDFFRDMGCNRPSFTYPISVFADDFEYDPPNFKHLPTSISFIGSLDWMPNQEGLMWFVSEVWPLVVKDIPSVSLWIAGRHIPDFIYELKNDQIHILGEVPDSAVFLKSYPITIVPLFSGSGMRAKIIEAMSLGPAIVSTTIGAEGIEVQHGVHLKLADSRETFAEAIKDLILDQGKASLLSHNARELINSHYDAEVIGLRFKHWLSRMKKS